MPIKSFAHYSGIAVTFFSPEQPAHDGPGKVSARRDIKEVTRNEQHQHRNDG